jgi:hypothetical protein
MVSVSSSVSDENQWIFGGRSLSRWSISRAAERIYRPDIEKKVAGEGQWLPGGAKSFCELYTLIETAKANN